MLGTRQSPTDDSDMLRKSLTGTPSTHRTYIETCPAPTGGLLPWVVNDPNRPGRNGPMCPALDSSVGCQTVPYAAPALIPHSSPKGRGFGRDPGPSCASSPNGTPEGWRQDDRSREGADYGRRAGRSRRRRLVDSAGHDQCAADILNANRDRSCVVFDCLIFQV